MSEAARIIAELRGRGMTQAAIAEAIGRSPRMVRKVEKGESSGAHYLDALGQLLRGEPVERPERVSPVSRQRTPAGVVSRYTRRGLRGLLRDLNARGRQRVSLRLEYETETGPDQGWLYRRGGRAGVAIADDLEALGAEPDNPDAIGEALDILVDLAVVDPDEGGASGLPAGVTVTSARVSPA